MSLESFISRPDDYSLKLFPMKLYGESQNIFLNTALSFSPRWLRFFSLLPVRKARWQRLLVPMIHKNKQTSTGLSGCRNETWLREGKCMYRYVCIYIAYLVIIGI